MRKVQAEPIPTSTILADPGDLGALVRAVRTSSGMTLEETALSLQVAKQTLQNLEKGKGSVSVGKTLQILRELGIRLHWEIPRGVLSERLNEKDHAS